MKAERSDFRRLVKPKGGDVLNRMTRNPDGSVRSEYCYREPSKLF